LGKATGGAAIVNIELLKHPLNWLIVWFMLLIAALAGKYAIQLFSNFGSAPASGSVSANANWKGVSQ
jgi:hypothetical protein